jgi:hypothetical protein
MFRTSADHHKGAYLFLVKNHLVKIRVFMCGERGNVAAYIHLFYVVSGVERYVDGSRHTSPHAFGTPFPPNSPQFIVLGSKVCTPRKPILGADEG